ncbi:hypothetical protein CDAR_481801 [Caerostris darwini]|uniref:Uncharacterized protein n=1 Tax=Caerostris darwini TaxID=1538125 RepID=A0AAV4UN79_9ARAC|nr:hypothetical protein CDAR_481801 [Caerostris darwini]
MPFIPYQNRGIWTRRHEKTFSIDRRLKTKSPGYTLWKVVAQVKGKHLQEDYFAPVEFQLMFPESGMILIHVYIGVNYKLPSCSCWSKYKQLKQQDSTASFSRWFYYSSGPDSELDFSWNRI